MHDVAFCACSARDRLSSSGEIRSLKEVRQGNTRLVSLFSNMPIGSFRHWAATLFHFTDQDVAALRCLCTENPTVFRYIAFGHEVCPSTGAPHLQIAIGTNQQLALARLKALIGIRTIHLEGARHILANYAYAIKVGAAGGEIEEYGERPLVAQGERKLTTLDAAIDAVKGGMKLNQLRDDFFGVYRGSPGAWIELIAQYTIPPQVECHALSPWQARLDQLLMHTPDSRTVNFYVDAIGNSGKSWYAKYYFQIHGDKVVLLQPGKRADMGYIFYKATLQANRRVVFVDCKRSEAELLDYRFLESLKDGWMQNGKYCSTTFHFEVPHVVVFMNEHPDMTKLSSDRYSVYSIRRSDLHDRD